MNLLLQMSQPVLASSAINLFGQDGLILLGAIAVLALGEFIAQLLGSVRGSVERLRVTEVFRLRFIVLVGGIWTAFLTWAWLLGGAKAINALRPERVFFFAALIPGVVVSGIALSCLWLHRSRAFFLQPGVPIAQAEPVVLRAAFLNLALPSAGWVVQEYVL